MAQTQFGFQSGTNNWMGSGTNQFGNFQTKQTGVSNVKTNTYNSRYPGFDEEDMKKLESMVADIQDPSERQDTMDYLYRAFYDTVQNEHKLKERNGMLNQQTYEIGNINNTDQKNQAQTKLKLSELAQQIKSTYHINANVDDGEVLNSFIEQTPNGQELLQNYINNGDNELLYVGGLQQRPQQAQGGGVRSLVNNPDVKDMLWDKQTTAGNVLDMMNLIGEGAEDIDNIVNRYLPTITGEKSTNNLADRINNLSEEEIAEYRKQYDKLVSEGKLKGYTTQVVGDNLVEQVWNAIFGKKSGKKYTDAEKGFTSWLIDQNANFGQYMIGANDELKGISSPNVVKFFSNIPGSTIKTLTATIRGMTNPYDTLSGLVKLIGTEEGHQALLQRYGSWDAIANTMNTDPVGMADDIASIANMVGNPLGKALGKSSNTKIANLGNSMQTRGSATDALAGKTVGGIYKGIDNNLINSSNKLVSNAGKYLEATSNLGKGIEYTKEGVQALGETSAGQAVKNWRNEMINKIVGIDEKDRKFIQDNKELVNDYVDGKKNVNTVYDTVKEKLSDKALEKTEMGQQYDKLSQNKKKVVNTQGLTSDKELMNTLKKNGISVDADGNLVFDKINEFSTTQQKALQDAWQVLKDMEGEKKLNAGQTLGQRKKMDNKINREGKPEKMSSSDIDTEKLIKRMRATLDGRAKEYIAGLKELDAEYNPLIDEVKQMKKDRFNSDGTLKDNAKSKLRNLTKAGNEEKLARLEKIAPGITQDLKALDVGLTVEKATKQGVGQYSKGAGIVLGIGQLLNGNIPGALASIGLGILATPKNFVRVIEVYPDIVQKLSDGVDLTANEISKLQDLSARIGANVE